MIWFVAGKAEPTKPEEPTAEDVKKREEEETAKKLAKQKEAQAKKKNPQWFQEEQEKSTKVYVSNLPSSITEDEFVEFMEKCGVIDMDVRNNKKKFKLYRDDQGNPKGDGLCTYFKVLN